MPREKARAQEECVDNFMWNLGIAHTARVCVCVYVSSLLSKLLQKLFLSLFSLSFPCNSSQSPFNSSSITSFTLLNVSLSMPVFEISPQLMQFGRADVELTQESPSIFWGSLCLPEPIFKSLLLLRSGCWWRLRSNYEGQMSGEDTHIHAERGERGDWEEGRKRGEKGGRMDGWRTNQWGAALKKTSERAKQSKAIYIWRNNESDTELWMWWAVSGV